MKISSYFSSGIIWITVTNVTNYFIELVAF